MSAPRPTVDEVIGTLQRSCDPTLLAEGIDDIVMLRRFEDEFSEAGLSIMPLGGRDAVLQIFQRRHELPSENIILFLADKDLWVYSGIPEDFISKKLLFTDGYSIENDLYRDGNLERLLTASERLRFEADLNIFVEWYYLSLSKKIMGHDVSITIHPQAVLQNPNLTAEMAQLRSDIENYDADLEGFLSEYQKFLRGKSLMALLVKQLSRGSRHVKHSVRSLMEHGVVAEGIHIKNIRAWLSGHL